MYEQHSQPFLPRCVIDLTDKLEELEANPAPDATVGYSLACSALHEINLLARKLELAGMPAVEIAEMFHGIRRVMASSPLGNHMQKWPDGYQGDFRAVEYIATGINRAPPSSFAFSLEQAMLHSGIVQQHRYKLRRQSEAFLDAIVGGIPHPRLLSIGCGGCRDLIPLLHLLRGFKGDLVLNDIDPLALSFAADRLQAHTNRFRPLCANVTSLVRLLRRETAFDLIIAGGLFDYIPDRLLIHLLKGLYRDVLAPGGLLLFTNIAKDNPFRPLMTYAVDWQLIERSEQGIRDLCACALIPMGAMEFEREESQLTWIVRLHKPVAAKVSGIG